MDRDGAFISAQSGRDFRRDRRLTGILAQVITMRRTAVSWSVHLKPLSRRQLVRLRAGVPQFRPLHVKHVLGRTQPSTHGVARGHRRRHRALALPEAV